MIFEEFMEMVCWSDIQFSRPRSPQYNITSDPTQFVLMTDSQAKNRVETVKNEICLSLEVDGKLRGKDRSESVAYHQFLSPSLGCMVGLDSEVTDLNAVYQLKKISKSSR